MDRESRPIRIVATRGDREHLEMVEWIGGGHDFGVFDIDAINKILETPRAAA